MHPYIQLTIPAEAEYLDIVRLNLFGFASKAGFSYEDVEDMKVAVAEACNNAILHAYGEEPGGSVDIRMELIGEEMAITVQDYGRSFAVSPLSFEAPVPPTEITRIRTSGMGLYLMQALMDDVQVEVESGKGTTVVLTKRLHGKEVIL
ncbi:anti-sigma B factor RsbW [Paenibacillus whitsoniae]|uniref:Anti-sigma B factor RsbW n=1 Tax=Paenibacillus whitsoniae TaxID=2496558 RepID=A0A3S0ARC1_9BACL|nr:anti-sigma B factor RsbW [Paenibacillus whitsoniae]RTE10685.1 anti-sigma B factor RsbW [Paenibacillus whitsoniae]